jgi:hypothetical protein
MENRYWYFFIKNHHKDSLAANVYFTSKKLEIFASVGKLEAIGTKLRMRFHNIFLDLDLSDSSIGGK